MHLTIKVLIKISIKKVYIDKTIKSHILVLFTALLVVFSSAFLISYCIFLFGNEGVSKIGIKLSGKYCYGSGAYQTSSPGTPWEKQTTSFRWGATKETDVKPTESDDLRIVGTKTLYSHNTQEKNYGSWSSYTLTSCTASDTCKITSGYKKYTRTEQSKYQPTACVSGQYVQAANSSLTLVNTRCYHSSSEAASDAASNGWQQSGCSATSCIHYSSGSTINGYQCSNYSTSYSCPATGTWNGYSCQLQLSGTNCIVMYTTYGTAICPSGTTEISGKCYGPYPSNYEITTSCNASNTTKCEAANLYQTRTFTYVWSDYDENYCDPNDTANCKTKTIYEYQEKEWKWCLPEGMTKNDLNCYNYGEYSSTDPGGGYTKVESSERWSTNIKESTTKPTGDNYLLVNTVTQYRTRSVAPAVTLTNKVSLSEQVIGWSDSGYDAGTKVMATLSTTAGHRYYVRATVRGWAYDNPTGVNGLIHFNNQSVANLEGCNASYASPKAVTNHVIISATSSQTTLGLDYYRNASSQGGIYYGKDTMVVDITPLESVTGKTYTAATIYSLMGSAYFTGSKSVQDTSAYTDWSDWTTTACNTSNTATCQSRTVYQYREKQWKWCK